MSAASMTETYYSIALFAVCLALSKNPSGACSVLTVTQARGLVWHLKNLRIKTLDRPSGHWVPCLIEFGEFTTNTTLSSYKFNIA